MEMIDVAEEDMTGAATGAEEGTVGASEGAGVVGTWQDGLQGRAQTESQGEAILAWLLKFWDSSCTQCYPCYFVNKIWMGWGGVCVCQTTLIVTISLVPIKNHHF